MEFRWEVGKWRNQPLRRPQQFEDSTFLSHISRTWTLALPAFFGGAIGLFHTNRKSGRIETKTSKLSLWGHSKSLLVVTSDFIYDLKNPRKVLCYQKLESFSIMTWIFMLTILAPATHCWCLPSNSMCPQGTESTCQWRQRLSWYFLQCPRCDTHQMPLKSYKS